MNISEYESSQETKFHGHGDFPFNIYLCSIPLDFSIVPVHWHNNMEIIYIKKGRGKITINLIPFEVSQGDIMIVPPGHLHSISQLSDHTMEYENIIFQLSMLMAPLSDPCTQKFFEPLLQGKIRFDYQYSPGCTLYSVLSDRLNAMDEICKTFPSGYQLAIKGQLFLFFYNLASFIQAPLRPDNDTLNRLKDILKYVEINYHQKISVADAAKICGFSKSHFMKFFKNNMSMSFTNYLNDYRLTIAARLLLSSSEPIVTIAVDTGFETLSYFNRLFRRKYQCTPSVFRKRNYNSES